MAARAVRKTGIRRVIASGGVLANQTLRNRLRAAAQKAGYDLCYPESRLLCTDNAGMVAALGDRLFQAGRLTGLDFDVSSTRQQDAGTLTGV